MARLGEKYRLHEDRLLGMSIGFPEVPYTPSEPGSLRGFKLIFYDATDAKIGELGSDIKTGKVSDIQFELMPLGCGAFSFICDDYPGFDIAYRTRVDIHPYFDDTPWFTGFVQTLPQPGKKRPYEYTGFGFFDQLDWIMVTETYGPQDIQDIVKDIVQNIVAPDTSIIYNAAKVENTGYTIDAIDFYLVPAKEAIQSLADMATGFEFGVDDSREFYFRAKDTDVNHSFWAGKHFQEVEIMENPYTIRNRLYIKVGLIQGEGFGYIKEGSNCIGYEEDAASIAAYGLREAVITAPDVLNTDDAREWAKDILSVIKDPDIEASINSVLLDTTRTKISAIGKAKITTHDGTEYELPIKKINYSISISGIVGKIDLGY